MSAARRAAGELNMQPPGLHIYTSRQCAAMRAHAAPSATTARAVLAARVSAPGCHVCLGGNAMGFGCLTGCG